jgi:tetratricopeptide (TPR) repeat protein
VFVGRERVISQLRAAADEARSGRGRLVLLSGEPGSGKTRTTEQLALYADIRGMKVLVGRCYEGEGAPAFWPWMQIIRAYSEDLAPQELLAVMGNAAANIANVVREVQEKLPDLAPPPALEPDKERFRFFDSITTFLKNASARQPLVLILDDLHWADESSLLLLEFLARELGNSSLLAIGTFRDLTLGRQHPLTRTLGELTRHAGDQRIALEGLTTSDIANYLELSSGVAPADALIAAIQQQTDGNPLFVAEIVRLLVAEGRLQEMGSGSSIAIPIPPSVREVIQRRLDRLSAGCDRLLATGSVMGRNFSLEVLCALHTESEDQVLDLLEEAIAARLIREAGTGPVQYTFSHALIRDSVYEQMSATRRARLHHRIALAIEEIYAGTLNDYLPALAYHFTQSAQSEDAEKAIQYSVSAAERATSLLAYEESVAHYEHALEVLQRRDEQEERRCDLLLALGEAQSRAGILDQARATLERAAAVARKLGRSDRMARAILGIAPGVVGVLYGKADPVLLDLIEEALRLLGESDSVMRARLLAHLSIAHYHAPKQRRLALSQEAVEMARRLNHPAALLPALNSHVIALMGFEQVEERLAVSSELLREAERVQHKEMILRGYYGQYRELLGLGLRPQLDEAIESYGRVAEELRQPSHRWLYPFGRSIIALLEGRLECDPFSELANRHAPRPARALCRGRRVRAALHRRVPLHPKLARYAGQGLFRCWNARRSSPGDGDAWRSRRLPARRCICGGHGAAGSSRSMVGRYGAVEADL